MSAHTMKSLYMLLSFTLWTHTGLAQDSELSLAVEQLPQCAQLCLATAVQDSSCELTDTTCVCTNAELQSTVEACLLQSCTIRQSLTTKNLTSTLCHAPIRNTGNEVRISNIVLGVITAACALTRISYKAFFSAGALDWDDYSVLAALAAGVPSTIIVDRGIVPNGLGQDVWTVPFDHIQNFVRYLYALEVLYFLQIALIKLTLLFFFLRIFPKPLIRRLIWATVAFVGLYGLSFTITAVFQCRPISFYWMSWDQEASGQCVNINALAWTNAIISIVLDIWMLILPLYEVFQLQLTWRKKISVSTMFFVGTFVTIVSGLRLDSLVHFAASTNPTFEQTEVIKWSNIEINVGIICSCMPALRVILMHMFPKALASTRESAPQYERYGSHSHAGASKGGNREGRKGTPSAAITITYTKTFTVKHGETDEMALVRMDEFGAERGEGRGGSAGEGSV